MTDYLHLIDPDLRDAAVAMRDNMAAYTPMNRRKLAQRRAWMASITPAPLPDVPFARHEAPRPASCGEGPAVTVYAVNAKPGAKRPGILHIHGGGFTASTAIGGLPKVQELARILDIPIVTVEYRLAPETIWSGSRGDNYAAFLWMHAHAAELGVDPARIALMGESAGGGHVALLSMLARDRAEAPSPVFQALVYPMLDDRTGTSRQPPEHVGYYGWNREANRFGWQSFLGRKPGGRAVLPEAVPARCDDLSGLPPAWIGCGSMDLFVGESITYAARLLDAAVPAELLVLPGAFHGFDAFAPNAPISQRFTEAKIAALRGGLGLG